MYVWTNQSHIYAAEFYTNTQTPHPKDNKNLNRYKLFSGV